MANKEIKTNAEIYREQRKERLAKAAKKKSSAKHDKAAQIATKVICILLVAGIALFAVGKIVTDVFCIPQKMLTAATYNGDKLSVAEYNYYYTALYNQAAQVAQQQQQYAQYGYASSGTYFSTSVSPSEQTYPEDDAPDGVVTWEDYFRVMAPQRGFIINELYKAATGSEAAAAGFVLTQEKLTEIETSITETVTTYADQAKQQDFALDNYLSRVCGEGVTEKLYRELLNKELVAQEYLAWYQEQSSNAVTDEQINEYYAAHADDFDVASFRYFTVSYAKPASETTEDGQKVTVYTKEEAKARADEFASKSTTEELFISNSKTYAPAEYKDNYKEDSATLIEDCKKEGLTVVSDEAADWVLSADRKVGEIKVFDSADQECYYIFLMTETRHKDVTPSAVDVRHILIQYETTKTVDGKEVSLEGEELEAAKETAKKEAETLLKQWEDGEATEDSFAALAKEHSDDTGSKDNGGLYEDINSETNFVANFKNWALDTRKPGETEIVETEHGYHIMYFVSSDGTEKWSEDIRTTISEEDYNVYFDGILDSIAAGIKTNTGTVNFFADRHLKTIEKNIQEALKQQYSQYIA